MTLNIWGPRAKPEFSKSLHPGTAIMSDENGVLFCHWGYYVNQYVSFLEVWLLLRITDGAVFTLDRRFREAVKHSTQ